jgi:hypothetical protein
MIIYVSVQSRTRFTSPHCPDRFYIQPSFLFNCYPGSFTGHKADAACMISDLHITLRLISGAIPPRRYTPLGRGHEQLYVYLFTAHWQAYSSTLGSTLISAAVDMLWNWDEMNQAKMMLLLRNFCKSLLVWIKQNACVMQDVILILTNTNVAKISTCPHYYKGLPPHCRLQSIIK